MKRQHVVATVLLSVSLVTGLAAVPVQAVSPDCTEDYTIPASEPSSSRTLGGSASETGLVQVSASDGNKTVRVQLDSNNDDLEFRIFEVINDTCQESPHIETTACEGNVTLETMGPADLPPESRDCKIDGPDSGTRDFYFVFENQQSDSLEYSAWEVS